MIPTNIGIKKETIIYGAIALVGMLIIIQILRKTGLFTSKERKALKAEKATTKLEKLKTKTLVKNASIWLKNSDAFKINYHSKFPNSLIDQITAQDVAKVMRKSMRGPGTRESTLMGAFETLKNQAQVSQVAKVYYNEYKRSLITDVLSELRSDKERFDLYSYIAKLPKS